MQEDYFGLDIGSSSIKVVQYEQHNGRYQLRAFGHHPAPAGAVFSEAEIDQKELVKAIKEVVRESHIKSKNVVTAFPESLVFTRVIEIPAVTPEELASAVEWQAEQYIPMPLTEVRLSWMVLDKELFDRVQKENPEKKPKIKILLVAAPNALIQRYLRMINEAGLKPIAFETEVVAISRALAGMTGGEAPNTLLMSIGSNTTDLAVVKNGVIQFTRSIGTGGVSLSRAISQELGFDMNQAEEYKKAYGLLEDQLEGKIMQVIKPVIDVIVSEVERAIMYFQSNNQNEVVKRVVLTGGSSQLPGLVVFLANSLGLEVQIGDPWMNITIPDELKDKVTQMENQVMYAVAAGLAMRPQDDN